MKTISAVLATMALLCIPMVTPAEVGKEQMTKTMKNLEALQESGKFEEADALVKKELENPSLSPAETDQLQYEIERSIRIRKDYNLDEASLKEALGNKIADFSDKDFEKWMSEKRFDSKVIDGKTMFVGSSPANLLFRYADASARRKVPKTSEWENYLWRAKGIAEKEVTHAAQSTAGAHQFKLTMTISVDGGAVPKGDTIRVWMPYPIQNEFQSEVQLLESSPDVKWINNPTYPARSLYFEQASNGDDKTVFKASYTLTTHARANVIDPAVVAATDQKAGFAGFAEFTREQDHVNFTPEIKALAKKIVGEETNPAIKAKKIYDYLSMSKKYSYAREYSTIRDIPAYVCANGYGDCGQIALTYITLCRASGVPARWQSGWIIYPIKTNLHDWTEIHLAPYGWVPVDANYGMDIQNYLESFTPENKEALRNYYFGGLDAYRLVANSEHSYPHYPEKKSHRSDDVDFQRGEVEANGKNIYFDQFDYKMEVEFLTPDDQQQANQKPKTGAVLKPGVVR